MKKKIIFSALISALLLSGCFGLFGGNQQPQQQQQDQQHSAADQQDKNTQTQIPANTIQASVKEPPSFQDGDYYLQALNAHSIELCAKIGKEKLRARCETDVKKSGTGG